jgi:hypothetical protein
VLANPFSSTGISLQQEVARLKVTNEELTKRLETAEDRWETLLSQHEV